MRFRPLALAIAALLITPALLLAHDELPAELKELLEPLPDGTYPSGIGSHHDVHSENMILVANWDDDGTYRQGSDLAFWGNTAVLGNYDNPGGFRLVDIANPANPNVTRIGRTWASWRA
jgi:hypothetical protein